MSADPYGLARFLAAQAPVYDRALKEIRGGRKRSHWMWFVFPQFAGLGRSALAQQYAIGSLEEARAYLAHPTLGPRLVECAEAVLGLEGQAALDIFGTPDDLKLRSCATLFAQVSPRGSVFHRIIDTFFGGIHDARTLELVSSLPPPDAMPRA